MTNLRCLIDYEYTIHAIPELWLDRNLECSPTAHFIKGLLVVAQLEDIGNHSFGSDLAAV